MVRHGVDTDIWVEGPDGCEQTLLHKAIGNFNVDHCNTLGGNLNITMFKLVNRQKFSITDENLISAAIFLIRAGCDLDSPRRPGVNGTGGDEARDLATPLHLCCQWGIDHVVETLLEHGASINAKVILVFT